MYNKLLLLLLLTFCVSIAKAQPSQYTPMTAAGYQMKRIKTDSTLHIPSFCGTPTLRGSTAFDGAIALDTCNNVFYKWTHQAGWTTITGGGGGSQNLQSVLDFGNSSYNRDINLYGRSSANQIYLSGLDNNWMPFMALGDSLGGGVYTYTYPQATIEFVNKYQSQRLKQQDSTRATIYLPTQTTDAIDTLAKMSDVRSVTIDTTSLSERINLRVKYTDTSSMLSPYYKTIDTTNKWVNSVTKLNDSTIRVIKNTTTTDITLSSISTSVNATRLITTVYNNSGTTIPKGSVVYINGRHSSNLPTVALAQANSEDNSYKTFAIVENDITTSNSGIVIQAGNIGNLNLPTSSYTDGDIVYLSATVNGGITTTKPLAPNHICKLGSVTRAHPIFGSIEVKIENGWQMDELSDVKIALVPNDSTLLQFSRVDSLWHDVSVVNAIGTKYIKPSDTASMLSPYQRSINAVKYSDTSVFQRKSISAYSFMANNTASAANTTAQTFRTSGLQTYSGTITWTGTTAPSGTTNHTYNWTQVGNLVTINVTLLYGTAGSALTQVTMALPSGAPNPVEQTGLGAANEILGFASGQITTSPSSSNANFNRAMFRINPTDTGYELFLNCTSSAAYRYANITVQYFTNQ